MEQKDGIPSQLFQKLVDGFRNMYQRYNMAKDIWLKISECVYNFDPF